MLSQPSPLLQIQTHCTIPGSVVAMPTVNQDKSVPVAAAPLVSVALRTPSSDEDVSQSTLRFILLVKEQSSTEANII